MFQNNIIEISQGGQRIDQYLTKHFSYSRNFWERVIERGGIQVESIKYNPTISGQAIESDNLTSRDNFEGRPGIEQGKKIKKSYILKDGDAILIDAVERYLDGGILAESPVLELDIRLEKEDYLVLYKAKGILSHPNSVRDVTEPNIVGALYHHFKELPSMANFVRAGLIHRLDRDTDGLMLIAKTEKGLAHFKELFQQKSGASTIADKEAVPLKKFYRAVCDLSEEGARFLDTIKVFPHYLESFIHPKVPIPGEPKWGITKMLAASVITSEAWGSNTVDCFASSQGPRCALQLEILTGRTHQIRYQLSEVGLPIVSDYLYNAKCNSDMIGAGIQDAKFQTTDSGQPTTNMQLTAWKLEFLDNEGEMIMVSMVKS